jgi:serine/threonine protein kinase
VLKRGDRIGEWVVDSVLGEGGMGAVYRVHSALTQRLEAALKVMKPTIDEDARHRFVREAEALSALRHPAIVRVMGFSEDPSRSLLYLVMELAIGETLKERLARGPMPLPEALRTFVPLASALDHAHEAGIFHRDLKPANVVLCNDGTPRLVDFGIAGGAAGQTLTGTGQMGTLAYLPPEVFRGVVADPRGIDVYGFGLLLYEALTGTRSYAVEPGLTPAAAAASVGVRKLKQERLALSADFPQPLRDAVAAATDPDPAARPTMGEFRKALQSLVDRRGAAAFVPPPPAPRQQPAPAPLPVRAPAPPVDRTMRIPDPPQPDLGDRIAAASKSRGGIIAAAIALLVAIGLAFALMSGGDEGADRSSAAERPESEARPAGRSRNVPATAATTVPASPFAAAPSPAFGADTPVPPSPPATSARMTPLPSSPTAATPPPTAAAVTTFPTPPPRPSPSAAVVQPEVVEEDRVVEPEERDEGPPVVPLSSDVSGEWNLTNRVVSTDYEGFRGLNLGYRITLQQNGSRITGSGVKVTENGAATAARTPITISGRIEGSSLVLTFTEQGSTRTSSGTFRWQLSPDGASLRGSFWSDAANTNGPSSARRAR